MILMAGRRERAGRPNRTIFLPLKNSAVVTGRGPSLVMRRNVASGRESPTLIVMEASLAGKERAAGPPRPLCIANRFRRKAQGWRPPPGRSSSQPVPGRRWTVSPRGDGERGIERLLHEVDAKAIGAGRRLGVGLDVEPPGLRRLDEQIALGAGLGRQTKAPAALADGGQNRRRGSSIR